MPISGTVYATVLILDFVAHWNDFMWPLLVVTGEEKRTIQLAIQTFFGSKPINYGPIMASLTISAIPMLIMFIVLQKYYVEGIASTGIKDKKIFAVSPPVIYNMGRNISGMGGGRYGI